MRRIDIISNIDLNAFGNNELAKAVRINSFGQNHLDDPDALNRAIQSCVREFASTMVKEGIELSDLRVETEMSDYSRDSGLGVFANYKMVPNPFTQAWRISECIKSKDKLIKKYESAGFKTRLKWLFTGIK